MKKQFLCEVEAITERLEDIIKEANEHYTNKEEEEPLMSDCEYDLICQAHRTLSEAIGNEIMDSFSFLK